MIVSRLAAGSFRAIGRWAVVLVVVAASAMSARAADRRGGIEVGSKGVKLSVVELGANPGGLPKEVLTQFLETTISSQLKTTKKFAPDAIKDTAEAVAKFAKVLKEEEGLTPEQIVVVGSSGIAYATNRQELVDAVVAATGLAPMEFITIEREIELTIAGLLPKDQWPTAALVDVGSGNTKGGLVAGDHRVFITLDVGGTSFANTVSAQANGKPFAEAAAALRHTMLDEPLAAQVKAKPELLERKVVILSGGAAYAMTTLMHPEAIRSPQVTVTAAEISDYLKKLRDAKGIYQPDFEAIADPDLKAAAEKEYQSVSSKFKREELIAGAEILGALSTALQLEGKTLIFDRASATAWLRARLDPTVKLFEEPAVKVAEVVAESPKVEAKPAEPKPAMEKDKMQAETTEAKAPALPAQETTTNSKPVVEPVYPSPQSQNPPRRP